VQAGKGNGENHLGRFEKEKPYPPKASKVGAAAGNLNTPALVKRAAKTAIAVRGMQGLEARVRFGGLNG
jgi:hypothetical protein